MCCLFIYVFFKTGWCSTYPGICDFLLIWYVLFTWEISTRNVCWILFLSRLRWSSHRLLHIGLPQRFLRFSKPPAEQRGGPPHPVRKAFLRLFHINAFFPLLDVFLSGTGKSRVLMRRWLYRILFVCVSIFALFTFPFWIILTFDMVVSFILVTTFCSRSSLHFFALHRAMSPRFRIVRNVFCIFSIQKHFFNVSTDSFTLLNGKRGCFCLLANNF